MHLLYSPCCWSLGRRLPATCEAQTFICWQCPPQLARAGVPVTRHAPISAKIAFLIICVSFLPLGRGGEPPAPPPTRDHTDGSWSRGSGMPRHTFRRSLPLGCP